MLTFFRNSACLLYLFCLSTTLYGQNDSNTRKQIVYIKFSKDRESVKRTIANLEEQFHLRFKMDTLISNVLNGDIYRGIVYLEGAEAISLKEKLRLNDEVEYFSMFSSSPPKPPIDIPPTTPILMNNQTYLKHDPGVNALFAWEHGADGTNVNIKVLEYGLNIDHEEFNHTLANISRNAIVSPQLPYWYIEHGTMTAGVVFADNGDYGISGIAHNANEYMLYPEWEEGYDWDRTRAIAQAIDDSKKGDVLIYEMQTAGGLPAEYEPIVWNLTKMATEKGVIVVAAAGNGNNNLDHPQFTDYRNYGDSGAIIVGAGFPNITHRAHDFSTFGTRVNVQGWGTNVFTTGLSDYLNLNDINQYYSIYAGTSSATAMVGGCVAAVQSYYFRLTNQFLTSEEMRNLLIDTGTPQLPVVTKKIGPLPNLKAAIESIDAQLALDNMNNESLLHITVFPNPADDFINIKQINIEPKTIRIYDVLGKYIMKATIDKRLNTIDISALSSGLYHLRIEYKNQLVSKKIIKR